MQKPKVENKINSLMKQFGDYCSYHGIPFFLYVEKNQFEHFALYLKGNVLVEQMDRKCREIFDAFYKDEDKDEDEDEDDEDISDKE